MAFDMRTWVTRSKRRRESENQETLPLAYRRRTDKSAPWSTTSTGWSASVAAPTAAREPVLVVYVSGKVIPNGPPLPNSYHNPTAISDDEDEKETEEEGEEDEGPPMTPEQASIVMLAMAGHNFFYTGPAGSGKSFVLHRIKSELVKIGKQVMVVAPTGIAAYAVGGTTIHHFLRLSADNFKKKPLE